MHGPLHLDIRAFRSVLFRVDSCSASRKLDAEMPVKFLLYLSNMYNPMWHSLKTTASASARGERIQDIDSRRYDWSSKRNKRPLCLVTIALILLVLSTPATLRAQTRTKEEKRKERAEQAASLPAVICRDSDDIRALNLFYGAGGWKHAPNPSGRYTFVQERLSGTNPKFDVEDDQGVEWRVKLDSERHDHPDRHNEPQPETAASRLLWAAGYFVDEDYYLADLKVLGLPTLHRGQQLVAADGTVHGVRLKRRPRDVKRLGNWDWFDNPFLGTRELNGLRVMMALLNNWDLDVTNNAVDEVSDERRFLVSDIGASFGKTGNYFTHSKGVLEDYASSRFIEHTTADHVDFTMHTRPFFLVVFDFPYYRECTRREQITKHIPRADARWLGQKLALLSEQQLRDCFRAAQYTPEQIDGFARVVHARIAALNAL